MPLQFKPDVTPRPAEGIDTSSALRPSDIVFDEVTGMPYPAWAPAPSEGFLALGSRSDYSSVAAGTQSLGLTPAGFASDALTRAEVDPVFSSQMQAAAVSPGGWGFEWAKNAVQGLVGEDQDIFDFTPDAEFDKEANATYVDNLFKTNPDFYNSVYTPEMMREFKNSPSREAVDFKVRRYGRMVAADESIKEYDRNSNVLTYAGAKFISGGMNYVGQDTGFLPSVILGGAALHGVRALAGTSKLLAMGMTAVSTAAETGLYMYGVESANANTHQQLGDTEAAIDNTTIGWALGLGAVGGMALGAFVKNPRIAAALADEAAGAPMATLRAQGMATAADLANAQKSSHQWTIAARAAFIDVGADLSDYTGWATGLQSGLRFTPFKNADEVLEWVATARPAKAELDELNDAVARMAAMAADPSLSLKVKRMTLPRTDFQKTGVAPRPDLTAKRLFANRLEESVQSMNGTTAVGILSQIPGAKSIGKLLDNLGTYGVRSGAGIKSTATTVAYAAQKLLEVGMRGSDQTIIKLASNTVDASRRTVQRFFGAELGLTNIMATNSGDLSKAASEGIVSKMVDLMAGNITTTGRQWADDFARKFKEGILAQGKRAEAAGLIKSADDYFPIIFNPQAIRADAPGFAKDLFKYLKTTFTKEGADLNRINLRSKEWITSKGRITTLGAARGLGEEGTEFVTLRLNKLDDTARAEYLATLDESLTLQATRTSEVIEGGLEMESLLVNPDGVQSVVAVGRGSRTNSARRQTFDKDIYTDGNMSRWMEQNPAKFYEHATGTLANRTEFALSQIDELGKATHYEEIIDQLKEQLKNDKGLTGAERSTASTVLDQMETEYRYALGIQPKAGTAFDSGLAQGVVDTAVSSGRALLGGLWGIPVATMELPQALAVSGGMREAGRNLSRFFKSLGGMKRGDRWDLMAAHGEAVDHMKVQTRGILENSAHEGQFLGFDAASRFSAPWINIVDNIRGKGSLTSRIARIIPDTSQAAGALMTAIGGMPVMSQAGRIMVGRYSERYVARSLKKMIKFQKAVGDSTLTPKQFKALAKRMGFKHNDAELLNRSGMLEAPVTSYLDDAMKAGAYDAKDLDYAKLYEWAKSADRLEDHRRFSRAMTSHATERMNSAFATPSITSRVGTNESNPLMNAMTTFWSFPAAFYQQRLKSVGGDSSFRGLGLVGSYMGFEVLHRSTRDVVNPNSESFLDPGAVAKSWEENPGKHFQRTLLGGLPITGLYPLGAMYETLIGDRIYDSNFAEGRINKILTGVRGTFASDRSASRAGQWVEALNAINSSR